MTKKCVVANWKMYGDVSLLEEVARMDTHISGVANMEVVYCLPSIVLPRLVDKRLQNIIIGGQDCHSFSEGAFTGDISARMLVEAGAKVVIVGHSERRLYHQETDDMIAKKGEQAHKERLTIIVCVGESEAQRKAGQVLETILKQIEGSLPPTTTSFNTMIAYEPIWAIGTGRIPLDEEIHEVHKFIHDYTKQKFIHPLKVLYGGSVKPQNANTIAQIDYVDGALVGGASLKFEDFYPIVSAFSGE